MAAVDNPRLEQLTEELAERLLTVKGRKVYGYLPPRVKAIVDAIVEELAKDERVSAAYETWQTLYEQVCLDYDQRPPKRLPLSRQKEFRSVRNMVIQETLQWMAERQRCADAQRTSATSVESISPENSAAATKAKVRDPQHQPFPRSPNLTVRRAPHRKIPAPLTLPPPKTPHRLWAKMSPTFTQQLIRSSRANRTGRSRVPCPHGGRNRCADAASHEQNF